MNRKYSVLFVTGFIITGLLAGCGNETTGDHTAHTTAGHTLKDGTYTAKSSPDDRGAIGEIAITVQQGKITQAEYKGIQKDGKIKDAEYGKTNGKIENPEFYKKAQQAVKGAATYAPKLVAVQDVEKVDAVSGATVSYKQFVEAGQKALEQAR